ncbi:BTB/POZ domain-containing protein [Hibiscus syriacus]|uniref:BTB/POZ domain-containing protein n=1 Tax=Hibiscus syriacus TaxID=106335 RepID=A0A6A3CF12_HIBSY|nr:BTB/POZ domain-containing protein [Hibiscus syriacus]
MSSIATQSLETEPELNSNVVSINVGGQIFQTTKQTLTQAGPKSLLSQIAGTGSDRFVDRDPDHFSLLLSLLRSGSLPSKVKDFDLRDLIEESRFYGLESLLTSSLTNPSQFDGFALQKSSVLPLNGRDCPSAIASTPLGRRFLLALSPDIAAAGATDFSGLQILDLHGGCVKQVLNWENSTRSGSTVQAIGSSGEFLFTSFESSRRNSNSILVYDLNNLNPVIEIGHSEIFGADLDSAIPATKLKWVSSYGLLMASGSHSGLSGVTGNIRFWDIRSGNVVFDLKEKVDCFADVCVSDNLSVLFKVGVNSGEVFNADLRRLGSVNNDADDDSNPWICLGDRRKVVNEKKEGFGCKIESHGNQVFCSKGGDIELWSEVTMGSEKASEGQLKGRVFRKNLMGRVKDTGGLRITNLALGGNKMFVTRKDQQAVEIWQGSTMRGFDLLRLVASKNVDRTRSGKLFLKL